MTVARNSHNIPIDSDKEISSGEDDALMDDEFFE